MPANKIRFDNNVYFPQGAKIGKKGRCAAKAVIFVSYNIGNNVWIGPSTSISSSLTIGARVNITIGAVVTCVQPYDSHV